jgi:hypothetical protein
MAQAKPVSIMAMTRHQKSPAEQGLKTRLGCLWLNFA